MALTVNTKIINDVDNYSLDAKQVKGGYGVVDTATSLSSLPTATIVEGSLYYVQDEDKFYKYNGSTWEEAEFGGGNVDDVKVNGTSVVTDKVANIDLTVKQDVIDATHKLSSDLVDDTNATNKFVTAQEKTDIGTAIQPNDNVSELTNDAGYVTSSHHDTSKQDKLRAGNGIEINTITSLPTGYKRLEYIQSDRTKNQYINTGFTPNQDTAIEVYGRFLDIPSNNNYQALFGISATMTGTSDISIQFLNYTTQTVYEYWNSGLRISEAGRYDTSYDMKFKISKGDYYINDELVIAIAKGTFTSAGNLLLFTKGYGSSSTPYTTNNSTYRMYYTKIWDNDTLIREMYPVQQLSDSKYGLYDVVNNVFYPNLGIGDDFTAGPEITENTSIAVNSENYLRKYGSDTVFGEKTFYNRMNIIGAGDENAVYLSTNTRFNAYGTNYTVLGFMAGTYTLGNSVFPINLRGSGARPTFNGSTEIALRSDIPDISNVQTKLTTNTSETSTEILNNIKIDGVVYQVLPKSLNGNLIITSTEGVTATLYNNSMVYIDEYTYATGETEHTFSGLSYGAYYVVASKGTKIKTYTVSVLFTNNYYTCSPSVTPYKDLEYLETSGTQYLATGKTQTCNISSSGYVEVRFRIIRAGVQSYEGVFGLNGSPQLAWITSSGAWSTGAQSAVPADPTLRAVVGNDYTYKWTACDGKYYINNTYVNIARAQIMQYTLWKVNDANQYARIYWVRTYDYYGNLEMELIPCLDTNEVPCMYNTVEQRYYYNSGTGSFIPGPEV